VNSVIDLQNEQLKCRSVIFVSASKTWLALVEEAEDIFMLPVGHPDGDLLTVEAVEVAVTLSVRFYLWQHAQNLAGPAHVFRACQGVIDLLRLYPSLISDHMSLSQNQFSDRQSAHTSKYSLG
jgi:hypothetical protein